MIIIEYLYHFDGYVCVLLLLDWIFNSRNISYTFWWSGWNIIWLTHISNFSVLNNHFPCSENLHQYRIDFFGLKIFQREDYNQERCLLFQCVRNRHGHTSFSPRIFFLCQLINPEQLIITWKPFFMFDFILMLSNSLKSSFSFQTFQASSSK